MPASQSAGCNMSTLPRFQVMEKKSGGRWKMVGDIAQHDQLSRKRKEKFTPLRQKTRAFFAG